MIVFGIVFSVLIYRHVSPQYISERKAPNSFDFNPIIIEESVSRIPPPSQETEPLAPAWELTSAKLVGHDNALALAKLRIDIERVLRQIAFTQGIDLGARPVTSVRMAEVLVREGLLPAEVIVNLKPIISVCNRAIHGEEIPTDLTDSVVSIGEQVVLRLRALLDLTGRQTGEEPDRRLPAGKEVIGYLSDHPDGLRLRDLEAYFDVPRRELREIVNELIEHHRVRRDPERQLYFAADDDD
jgi:hypothetical protein